jgi:FAD/FMN-containing dehydrogenase
LNIALLGKVSFPNSTIYDLENAYWSQQQAEINSTCRVTPTSSIDVSLTLYVLEFLRCEFAVKSGGHAAFAGASNIKDGVTIDMANLNEIVVSKDQTVTSLGPGNRWVDVYTRLEPLNLSVVGGRTADIGVGGLLLGGGISFFSQRFGFACDNVLNYEVLLSSGILPPSLPC